MTSPRKRVHGNWGGLLLAAALGQSCAHLSPSAGPFSSHWWGADFEVRGQVALPVTEPEEVWEEPVVVFASPVFGSTPPQPDALDMHWVDGALSPRFLVVQTGQATVTDYDTYTGRQTGMYRNTHKLKGDSAGRMIRACCDKSFCLKQRLWTCPPLKTDSAFEKSILPCLEPCALMLEIWTAR